MTMKPYRTPAYACLIAMVTVLYFAGVYVNAQSTTIQPPTPEPTLEYIKSIIGTVTVVAGFISLITGIVLGMVNRANTERLKANIQELEGLVDTKDARNEELKLQNIADNAKHDLIVERLNKKVSVLEVSNESVVGHNLQMKAILKGLRLNGKWSGHEDDLIMRRDKS